MSKMVRGAVALAVGSALLLAPGASPDPGPRTPSSIAQGRLAADAVGNTTRSAAPDGRLRWLGTGSGAEVRNPDVTPGLSAEAAATAHLRRYGPAFGLDGSGSRLTVARKHDTVHNHVTIFGQDIDGVPVLASGVSVETGPDGQLRSVLADVSEATAVPAVVIAEATAARTARGFVARSSREPQHLRVVREGRAIYDPAVVGADPSLGRHSVWGFTVSSGPGTAHSVLVDDQTGGIVADIDRSEALDRVVCDNANVAQSYTTSCTSGFARTEAGAPAAQPDVNRAFDELGATAQFYADVAGIDLTTMLGRDIGGSKHLAATVRYCENDGTSSPCPMANAFWFNQQMYTGTGWAVDDVVGHEMTHGVIEKNARTSSTGASRARSTRASPTSWASIVDRRNWPCERRPPARRRGRLLGEQSRAGRTACGACRTDLPPGMTPTR
jgi:bacillolysin